MGCNDSKALVTNESNKSKNSGKFAHDNDLLVIPKEQDEEFPDKQEWGKDYVGEGLKRIHAYKYTGSKEELDKERNAYWEKKYDEDAVFWGAVNEALTKSDDPEKFLMENKIKIRNGRIDSLTDKNNKNYHIPNFIIHDPLVKTDEPPLDTSIKQFITIYLIDNSEQKKIKISNILKVSAIKEEYIKKYQLDQNSIISLTFEGKELNEESKIFTNGIKDGSQIVVNMKK